MKTILCITLSLILLLGGPAGCQSTATQGQKSALQNILLQEDQIVKRYVYGEKYISILGFGDAGIVYAEADRAEFAEEGADPVVNIQLLDRAGAERTLLRTADSNTPQGILQNSDGTILFMQRDGTKVSLMRVSTEGAETKRLFTLPETPMNGAFEALDADRVLVKAGYGTEGGYEVQYLVIDHAKGEKQEIASFSYDRDKNIGIITPASTISSSGNLLLYSVEYDGDAEPDYSIREYDVQGALLRQHPLDMKAFLDLEDQYYEGFTDAVAKAAFVGDTLILHTQHSRPMLLEIGADGIAPVQAPTKLDEALTFHMTTDRARRAENVYFHQPYDAKEKELLRFDGKTGGFSEANIILPEEYEDFSIMDIWMNPDGDLLIVLSNILTEGIDSEYHLFWYQM